jgi:transposase
MGTTANQPASTPRHSRVQMAQSVVKRWRVSRPLCSVCPTRASHGSACYLSSPWCWLSHCGKKRGQGLGDAGHKHEKGDKELTIVENHGFVLGPISIKPVNQQDTIILPETLTTLVDFTRRIGIDLCGSSLTLDAGFDSKDNKDAIKAHKMKPVIYPNRRNTQTPIAIARKFRWFDRARYRLRYKVERTFGWQDIYRKLAVSYDRLPEIRKGGRLLAYSMINFRVTFNTS